MKSDDLLRHLGSVKDEYIEEIMTESVRSARRRSGKRSIVASIAASLAIVILGMAVMAADGAKRRKGRNDANKQRSEHSDGAQQRDNDRR